MDYKNGKIYAIRSHQTDEIYIGSTTQSLSKRFSNHKSKYKLYLDGNLKKYLTSSKILQYDDAYIELFEEYPCDNKIMLNKREGEIIRLNNCVNKCIAGQTSKEQKREYYEKNKDKMREKQKEYWKQNKDKMREYCKEYYEQNKEQIKDKNTEYREQNKEKIKDKNKKYYEQNKEKIKEQKREYYEQNKEKNKE